MRPLVVLLFFLAAQAYAQPRPAEIDPNTKIEGGADVRGNGAGAGQQPRPDPQSEARLPQRNAVVDPDQNPKEDKPISARQPQDVDRGREDQAAKGETAKPQ